MQRMLRWAYNFLRWAGSLAWIGSLLAWVLRHWGDRVPMQRILESEHLQSFHHPQPSYPLHILIIPKEALPSLMSIGPNKPEVLDDLLAMVEKLVEKYELEDTGYRLIINGGAYQEIPQLHFHLVSDLGVN